MKRKSSGFLRFKFFVDWFFEHIRKCFALLAALLLMAYAGPVVQKIYRKHVPSNVISEEALSDSDRKPASVGQSTLESPYHAKRTRPKKTETSVSNFNSNEPERPPSVPIQTEPLQAQSEGSVASIFNRFFGGGVNDAKVPQMSASLPAKPNGNVQNPADAEIPLVGNISLPGANTDSGSGSNISQRDGNLGGFKSTQTPGFQVSSGGGRFTAAGVVMESSLGEVGGSSVQAAAGMSVVSGITGVLYH